MRLSLQGKGHTEMSPVVSSLPSGCKTMDEPVDVLSLIGTAGPILPQVSTFHNRMKGVSCPEFVSSCEKRVSPTTRDTQYLRHYFLPSSWYEALIWLI